MGDIGGLVLAAGQGRRMGIPKALLTFPGGATYLQRACRVLRDAGCAPVVAVLGARAEEAARPLGRDSGGRDEADNSVEVVVNPAWEEGMSTSLRAGLAHLREAARCEAVVVHLVDLPDVGPEVVARLLRRGGVEGRPAAALARAAYDGTPGHPVLIGRDHWGGVIESLDGDAGARAYLRTHAPELVEVGDLATGCDVDTPEQRLRFEAG